MAKIFHARVEKPFDKHETTGVAVALSERGYGAIANSSKHRGFVTLLAVEDDNGDVYDKDNNLVLSGKDRKGAPIDPFTVVAKAKDGSFLADREEKASPNTRDNGQQLADALARIAVLEEAAKADEKKPKNK